MLDLPDDEREYLIEMLREAHTQLLHQMHHSSTSQYRTILRERLALNERLLEKIDRPVLVAV